MDLSENKPAKYRHPWELSRTDIILKELGDLKISGDVLDIGCGDAYFDENLLKTFKNIDSLYGIDINLEESKHNKKAHYINNYEEIKEKKFDYILLMDVIEHIEDDYTFMKEIKQYLKPNGIILITVPAFQFVYGIHDKELSHYRRYNFKQLKDVLEPNGIYIKKWNYFYLSLLLVRFLTKNKSLKINTWKKNEKSIKTIFIKFILNLDYNILKLLSKIHIHIGGLSLIAICNLKNK